MKTETDEQIREQMNKMIAIMNSYELTPADAMLFQIHFGEISLESLQKISILNTPMDFQHFAIVH